MQPTEPGQHEEAVREQIGEMLGDIQIAPSARFYEHMADMPWQPKRSRRRGSFRLSSFSGAALVIALISVWTFSLPGVRDLAMSQLPPQWVEDSQMTPSPTTTPDEGSHGFLHFGPTRAQPGDMISDSGWLSEDCNMYICSEPRPY